MTSGASGIGGAGRGDASRLRRPSRSTPRLRLRATPRPDDPARVRAIVVATGFFSAEEVRIAEELVEERLDRGEASGYHFLFADRGPTTAGYTCYGPVPLTRSSWDLYWIAVDPAAQGGGLGRRLLVATEKRIRAAGGERVYAETSSRPQYRPTRAFYERCGYRAAARLADFYAPGDGKVIFEKAL